MEFTQGLHHFLLRLTLETPSSSWEKTPQIITISTVTLFDRFIFSLVSCWASVIHLTVVSFRNISNLNTGGRWHISDNKFGPPEVNRTCLWGTSASCEYDIFLFHVLIWTFHTDVVICEALRITQTWLFIALPTSSCWQETLCKVGERLMTSQSHQPRWMSKD